jgi:hypothetical protein
MGSSGLTVLAVVSLLLLSSVSMISQAPQSVSGSGGPTTQGRQRPGHPDVAGGHSRAAETDHRLEP